MNVPIDLEYAQQLHLWRKRLIDDLSRIPLTQLAAGFPHEQVIPLATYSP
jgi:hypothetical protein